MGSSLTYVTGSAYRVNLVNRGLTGAQPSNTGSSPDSSERGSGGRSSGAKIAIGLCVPLVVIAIVAAALFFFLRRRRRSNTPEKNTSDVSSTGIDAPIKAELAAVTTVPRHGTGESIEKPELESLPTTLASGSMLPAVPPASHPVPENTQQCRSESDPSGITLSELDANREGESSKLDQKIISNPESGTRESFSRGRRTWSEPLDPNAPHIVAEASELEAGTSAASANNDKLVDLGAEEARLEAEISRIRDLRRYDEERNQVRERIQTLHDGQERQEQRQEQSPETQNNGLR